LGFIPKAVASVDITDGSIVDADINASAAIAISKTAFSAGTGVTLSTNTLNVDAAQTGITSLLATNIKIGEDDQTKIDFEDDNKINFYANNAKEVELAENSLSPGTSDGTALGTTSLMWSDLFLASGGVLNFNNGNVTLAHSSNTLTITGATIDIDASTAVLVSNDLKLDSDSAILSLGAGDDATFTHDGTTGLTIAATPISIDSTGELHLNSTTGDIKLQDGGTDQITFDLDGTAGEVIMKPAVDSDDLVISQYDGTEVIRIEDNASLGLVGNKLSIANSSSDVVIKPLTDAKDIIFQQYDGTEVARVEDNATFNIGTSKLAINGTAVTATAAELNLLDGGTSVGGSITLADADGVVVNDGGTMKTIPASDIKTYASGGGTFDAVADGAISAGDLVGLSTDGKVVKLAGAVHGGTSATSPTSGHTDSGENVAYGPVCAYNPDTSTWLMVYSVIGSAKDFIGVAFTRAATGAITFGSQTILYNAPTDYTPYYAPQICYDTNADRFFVGVTAGHSSNNYNTKNLGIVVNTGADRSITAGTAATVESGVYGIAGLWYSNNNLTFMSGRNKICYAHRWQNYDSGGSYVSSGSNFRAHIITIDNSDNSFTTNSTTEIDSSISGGAGVAWDSNVNRLIFGLQRVADDDDLDAVVATHDSSDDSLTVGTITLVDDCNTSTGTSMQIRYWSSAQKVIFMYSDGTENRTAARVGTIASSGNSFTLGEAEMELRSEKQGNVMNYDVQEFTAGTYSGNVGMCWADNGSTTAYFRVYSYDSSNVGFETASDSQTISSFRKNSDETGPQLASDGTTMSLIVRSDNADARIDYVTPSISPPTTSGAHYSRWIGIANSAISDGATGTITSVGGVGTGQSSLTVGTMYRINSSAELEASGNFYTDASYTNVGVALTTSTIFITGGLSN